MMPRKPSASYLAKRSWSVKSLFSWHGSLRLPPRKPRLLPAVGRALVVARVVGGTQDGVVVVDAVVEAVGVAEVVL